jgi:hypothetical protein
MLVFYISFFFIPEYLTNMCLLCEDVGPVRPTDYVRNKRRPRPGVAPAATGGPTTVGELPVGEVERVLRRVQAKLYLAHLHNPYGRD